MADIPSEEEAFGRCKPSPTAFHNRFPGVEQLKDRQCYESRAFSQPSRSGIAIAIQESGLEVKQVKVRDLSRSLSGWGA